MAAKGFEFVFKTEVDPKTLGAQLRRLRESCALSATDLAERMGWNAANVMRLERGGNGREPTFSSVNLYVRMLGFDLVLAARPRQPGRTRTKRKSDDDAIPTDTPDDEGE